MIAASGDQFWYCLYIFVDQFCTLNFTKTFLSIDSKILLKFTRCRDKSSFRCLRPLGSFFVNVLDKWSKSPKGKFFMPTVNMPIMDVPHWRIPPLFKPYYARPSQQNKNSKCPFRHMKLNFHKIRKKYNVLKKSGKVLRLLSIDVFIMSKIFTLLRKKSFDFSTEILFSWAKVNPCSFYFEINSYDVKLERIFSKRWFICRCILFYWTSLKGMEWLLGNVEQGQLSLRNSSRNLKNQFVIPLVCQKSLRGGPKLEKNLVTWTLNCYLDQIIPCDSAFLWL